MEKSVVDAFIATCKEKGNKAAFIYHGQRISFDALLSDVYRMVNLLKDSGLKPGDKALILVIPSYEFYLLMFAGICYGLNLVVMDSYRDRNRIKHVLKQNGICHLLCSRATRWLKPLLGRGLKAVQIGKYKTFEDTVYCHDADQQRIVLTTFTSGTTGEPKPIERNLDAFREQICMISENIEVETGDVVFSKLPIYTLFVVFKGLTCVIARRLKTAVLARQGVTAVLAPIADLLAIEETLPFIKRVSIGGAMLYPKEIQKINAIFPSAEIGYVYGSGECVLMGKADLKTFAQSYALNPEIAGITLTVVNRDQKGVGQICVRGDVVLTESKEQVSNDLGYLAEDGLHIVGRKAFSAEGRYNYIMDRELLAENDRVQRGFSMVHDGEVYFCYEGTVSKKRNDVIYIRFKKLPMDAKHKTKLDYNRALSMIRRK